MDRGAWRAIVHGITKSWTQLKDFHFVLTSSGASGALGIEPVDDMSMVGLVWKERYNQGP